MPIKQESITSHKLGSPEFWWGANSALIKGKSAIPPLFNDPDELHSASDKATLSPRNFSKDSNLNDSVSYYLLPLLELFWKCIIFL